MSVKTRTTVGKYRRITALLVLTPMMLNASQALTLCVSQDGHAAVELVVQDRCACNEQMPGPQSILADVGARIADEQSQSCTDLAIPIGSCGIRVAPVASKVISVGLAAIPPLLSPVAFDSLASPSRAAAFPCPGAPLESIILRV